MKKFMLLYKGPATPPEQMSPDATQKVMENWKAWMEKVGAAIADMGQPMAPGGQSVVDDGSAGQADQLNGFSILQAEDMEAAVKLVDGHPFLSDKTGQFSVEVYELLPAPGM
ncbi:MAG TPA: YciI family protein [Candidatus Saccharimonadales bacterium]|nr:YciI family protein [Candidatus Saccharimonadales bacterium]